MTTKQNEEMGEETNMYNLNEIRWAVLASGHNFYEQYVNNTCIPISDCEYVPTDRRHVA
jgi:hypothetical protein